MSRISKMLVIEECDGMRLDLYLAGQELFPSRSAGARSIEKGEVTVNGNLVISKKFSVSTGDIIQIDRPDIAPSVLASPELIDLDIRYEDDYLLVLSKQMGLVCHPAPRHETGTLANALVGYCGAENLGTLQGEDRPGIVHRLDMDTTGLMCAAKSDEVQSALQEQIRLRTLDRRYITLVHGYIAADTGIVDAPIARSLRNRYKMVVSEEGNSRESVTTFSVLERFEAGPYDDGYTLLECKLYTGRTHQIRVHMKYIHHPCVGDVLYGKGGAKENHRLERQFLHSHQIGFTHPITGEDILLTDALPEDLQKVLDEIKPCSMGRTEYGQEVLSELEGK